MNDWFRKFARYTSHAAGTAPAFVLACFVVAAWALTGPMFDYSETWQLVINTGTTIVTFLMVFLIQNAQNRDSQAVQLKLDELIRAVEGARNDIIDLDELSDEALDRLHREFQRLGKCNHVPIETARGEDQITNGAATAGETTARQSTPN